MPKSPKIPSKAGDFLATPQGGNGATTPTTDAPAPQPAPESDDDDSSTSTLGMPKNPLAPAGNSLDNLIRERINADLWKQLKGELPCLEASKDCVAKLQSLAVDNSKTLKEIDERVEVINGKIVEAKKRNQKFVKLSLIRPLATDTLQKPSPLSAIMGMIFSPINLINKVLHTLGIPFLDNMFGGSTQAQNTDIAIADLETKVADIQKSREDIALKLKEIVMETTLAYDDSAREFQLTQELAKRAEKRFGLYTVQYRMGAHDTSQYLEEQSKLDTLKGNSLRSWSKMRLQIEKIKILVLGQDDEV